MTDENYDPHKFCGGRGGGCSFQHNDGVLSCVPGNSNCNPVALLEAEESDFHDCGLIEATKAIKEILANIPADPNGRNLSFLHYRNGNFARLGRTRRNTDCRRDHGRRRR